MAVSFRPVVATTISRRLQLGDVGSEGTEGKAADLGPAPITTFQGFHDLSGVLPGAPYKDGRASAGDGGAEGAEVAGLVDQLHRARVELAAAILVDAVGEAGSDEVEVSGLQAKHEARGGRDVGDGIDKRELGRDRLAGALGRDLLSRDHGDAL